jgi:hypothetical protein
VSYDPKRPRPSVDDGPELDALLGSTPETPETPDPQPAPPAYPNDADHRAESERRSVPTPAAPLEIDYRLVAITVLGTLIAVWLALRWYRRR